MFLYLFFFVEHIKDSMHVLGSKTATYESDEQINRAKRRWRVRVGGWEGNKYVLAVSHLIRRIDTDHSHSVSGRNRASEWVSERERCICVTDQRMHRTPLPQLVCLMKCVPWQDRAKWFKLNQPGLPSSTSNEPRNCLFPHFRVYITYLILHNI